LYSWICFHAWASHLAVDIDVLALKPLCSIIDAAIAMQLSLEETDPHGRTPLRLAVLLGYTACVQVLIEFGADVSLPDSEGKGVSSRCCLWQAIGSSVLLLRKPSSRLCCYYATLQPTCSTWLLLRNPVAIAQNGRRLTCAVV
jgi:hypothetical protein